MGKPIVAEVNRSKQLQLYYRKREEKLKKMTCECGSIITSMNIKQHRSSDKHQRLMKKQFEDKRKVKQTIKKSSPPSLSQK